MYALFLSLHNLNRWLVVIAAAVALFTAWQGLVTRRPWVGRDRAVGAAFSGLMDLQLVLGIVLYVISPITRAALSDFGGAMRNTVLRFFSLEHPLQMLIALVLVHVGYGVARRGEKTDRRRFVWVTVCYTIAVLLIIVGVPWTFGEQARPLFRLPF